MPVKREAARLPSPDATPRATRGAKAKLAVQQAADRAEARTKAKQPKPAAVKPPARAKAKKRAVPAKAGKRVKAAVAGPATAPAAKVGRPTDYRPEYCERIVELAYDQGMGAAELAYELRISRQTWHDWQAAHAQFLEAVTHARWAAQAWWERKGRAGINEGKTFNALAWKFQMLNRFREDYRDRQEKLHDVSDELAEMLTELDGATGRFRAAA